MHSRVTFKDIFQVLICDICRNQIRKKEQSYSAPCNDLIDLQASNPMPSTGLYSSLLGQVWHSGFLLKILLGVLPYKLSNNCFQKKIVRANVLSDFVFAFCFARWDGGTANDLSQKNYIKHETFNKGNGGKFPIHFFLETKLRIRNWSTRSWFNGKVEVFHSPHKGSNPLETCFASCGHLGHASEPFYVAGVLISLTPATGNLLT